MKIIFKFLKDQTIFVIIYIAALTTIIGYYQLTTEQAELLYPVLLALFFFVVYLAVRFVLYFQNTKNIVRLIPNSCRIQSAVMEYQQTYEAINKLHQSYNDRITALTHKATEDKRFISAFVHNLKTPVTVSDLILQRMSVKELPDELKETVCNLEFENKRLNTTLSMLLDLQRLEELANDYYPQPVSISEELTKIINDNKSLFINSKVYPKLSETDAVVYTDTKWNTVLINQIISNAVKYSKGAEPKHIYFQFESTEKYTSLIIQDEGIGIPEYDLPKIYDAFFTGENGREGYSSSGIGLYLCKRICDMLGHQIKIENNNGCRVTITYLAKQ